MGFSDQSVHVVMVEDIEPLGAEGESDAFGDSEILLQCCIEIPSAWPTERIAVRHTQTTSLFYGGPTTTPFVVQGYKGGLNTFASGGNNDERRLGQFSLRVTF
jgi:hypothetical protein